MEFKHTPEEARKLLAEDLRTTDAAQGKECLRNGKSFCCLGRACEVFKKHEDPRFKYRGSSLSMPEIVQSWYGFETAEGHFWEEPGHRGRRCLTHENDSGKTFPEIAAIIESNPPGLFVEPTNAT